MAWHQQGTKALFKAVMYDLILTLMGWFSGDNGLTDAVFSVSEVSSYKLFAEPWGEKKSHFRILLKKKPFEKALVSGK